MGNSIDIDIFCFDFGSYEDNTSDEELMSDCKQEQLLMYSHCGRSNDLYFDVLSPPYQLGKEEISKLVRIQPENIEVIEPEVEKPMIVPSGSVGILEKDGRSFKQVKMEDMDEANFEIACNKVSGQKLSIDAIIRIAGEKFIQSCSKRIDKLSILSHQCASSSLDLSDEEAKDVELLQRLLASAEKVGHQQFDLAGKLLRQCDDLSSSTGNLVQRLVFYFSVALRTKIDRETGKIRPNFSPKERSLDVHKAMTLPNPCVTSFYLNFPFIRIGQFTGVQSLVDNIGEAKKVHLIDLEIRSGTHCVVLMQALAARNGCPLEHLKITALGTTSKSAIQETGKRLMSFAQSLHVSFSFHVIMVADRLDLNEGFFELDADEAVSVYAQNILQIMITSPDRLEHLMNVLRNINTRVMVVTEVEANINSRVFSNRFIEALFFFGPFFDALKDCMHHEEQYRVVSESMFLGEVIQNIVAAEGDERIIRHVNMNTWRAFFARFGMLETDLSTSSLYQAEVLLKNFACGGSCTLELDGKSLIMGWKGTPFYSLSAWKFS